MSPKLEETIYLDFIISSSTGAAADADSLPSAEVFEDATDVSILSPTIAKRTSKTGDYRATVAATAANGFEEGKSYNVVASATVGGVAAKAVIGTFQVRTTYAANVTQFLGTAITETAGQIAAAFTKFFNKSSPTGTVNSLPDAVAGASGGLLIAGSNAATTFATLTSTGAFTVNGSNISTLTQAQIASIAYNVDNIIHVRKTGNDSGDGSYSAPYLTIDKAATIARGLSGKTLIRIGAGTYAESAALKFPAGCIVAGAGIDVTIITTTRTSASLNHGCCFVPGDGGLAQDFTLQYAAAEDAFQYLFGALVSLGNDTTYTNATCLRVRFVGNTDLFWVPDGSTTRLIDCIPGTKWDAFVADGTGRFELYNCRVTSVGLSQAFGAAVHGVGGNLKMYGGSVVARDGGDAETTAVQAVSGQTIDLFDVRIETSNSSGAGAVNDIVQSGTGIVRLHNCSYDRTKVTADDSTLVKVFNTPINQSGQFAVGAFQNSSITAAAIATDAITSAKIAAGAITSSEAPALQYLTGDAYVIVNDSSFGNAKLVRSTTPANTLSVDSSHQAPATLAAGSIATDAIDANSVKADAVTKIQSGLATSANQTTILNRLGAWTGTGVNTILGAFKALLSKAASAPSDIGGTFDPTTDSTEGIVDVGVNVKKVGGQTATATSSVNFDDLGTGGGGSSVITITPAQANSSNPRYSTRAMANLAQGSAPTDVWTFTDANGDPINLSNKTIKLVFATATDIGADDDEVGNDPVDDTLAYAFKYETSGDGLTVGGTDHNQVTLVHSATKLATVGDYRFFWWQTTDNLLLAKGSVSIEPTVLNAT